MAMELARQGWPLLLTARSADLLTQLESEIEASFQVPVETFAIDISLTDAPQRLADSCRDKGLQIQILINNAGFGIWETFEGADFEELAAMNALNVGALIRMCSVFLPLLRQHERAWLLNVSSLGAFQPLPYFAVYGAGKAYVRSFTYALRAELKDSPVSVTCLSPGGVDSDFPLRAGNAIVAEKNKLLQMSAEKCAKITLRAMFRGKAEVIPGWYNRVGAFINRLIPYAWSATLAGRIMRKDN